MQNIGGRTVPITSMSGTAASVSIGKKLANSLLRLRIHDKDIAEHGM